MPLPFHLQVSPKLGEYPREGKKLALEIGELGSSFPNNTKKQEYFQPLSIMALSLFVLCKISVSYIR